METLLYLTLPIFVVVGLGWLAARLVIVPASAVAGLNAYVFNFGMPCLVIGILARQPFEALLDLRLLLAWLIAGAVIFVLGALVARVVFSERLKGIAISAQAAAVGNIGFLGLPLLIEAFGDKAAGVLAAALIVDLLVFIPFSILLLEWADQDSARGVAVGQVVKSAFLNPFILSIIAGILLSVSGLSIPGPAGRTVEFLGAAAAPTALFALGLSLAGKSVEGDAVPIGFTIFLKLIVHPAVLLAAMALLGVPAPVAAIGVVLAALPVAGNVFVIAERYQARVRRSSSAVVVSTILAVVTVTLALEFAKRVAGS